MGRKRQESRPILESTCCPSAVVQLVALQKKCLVLGWPRVSGTLGKAISHIGPTQWALGLHHHVEAAVDWCNLIFCRLHWSFVIIVLQVVTALSI